MEVPIFGVRAPPFDAGPSLAHALEALFAGCSRLLPADGHVVAATVWAPSHAPARPREAMEHIGDGFHSLITARAIEQALLWSSLFLSLIRFKADHLGDPG